MIEHFQFSCHFAVTRKISEQKLSPNLRKTLFQNILLHGTKMLNSAGFTNIDSNIAAILVKV